LELILFSAAATLRQLATIHLLQRRDAILHLQQALEIGGFLVTLALFLKYRLDQANTWVGDAAARLINPRLSATRARIQVLRMGYAILRTARA
jgi:hypothetical protein